MLLPLKTYKKSFQYSYTLGVFPTLELITHKPNVVNRIIIHSKGKENQGIKKLRSLCKTKQIPIETNDRAIERLANKSNVFAIGVFNKYFHDLSQTEEHIVLVNPESMGNLGTIMRTMLGFNQTNLAIIQPSADIWHPKTIRASMGAIFQLNISLFNTLENYLMNFKHQPYLITGEGKTNLQGVKFTSPYTLIFGSESKGLEESTLPKGISVKIPQSKKIDSFNLAIAVGITLYQANLQNQ